MRWVHLVLVGLFWASAALAEGPVLEYSVSISEIEAQAFCSPAEDGVQVPAPETELGYVIEMQSDLPLRAKGQQVAAVIGMAFGVRSTTSRDVPRAKMELFRPGGAKPDIWYEDFAAGSARTEYFSFDFPQELVTGMWVFEAWDDRELLYRVGFSVLPAGALPDMVAGCGAVS